jgi:alpha-1,6-mannosyltransferase
LGHEHIVVAPGPSDGEQSLTGAATVRREGGRESRREVAPRVIRIAGPSFSYDPTYHLLWRIDKVRSIIRRELPDVLEIDSPYAAAAACATLSRRHFGIRTLVWHADFIDTYLRGRVERYVGSRGATVERALEPLWAMVRVLAGKCDATFVAAKWVADKLTTHGVPRVTLLPFGVERSTFSHAARSEEVRRALLEGKERSASTALLVGVGRFASEKRWDVILDAFARVRQERPAVLVLFGDGPERADIEARARGLRGDVRLMGFVHDRAKLAAALASADALVHGCPYETFGFAVAEAMSAGLPVVVPDAGGAGEHADIFSSERYASGDSEACARAVLRLLGRLDEGAPALRAHAVRASARLPTVREQFEHTYDAYAHLLRTRRPEWRIVGADERRGLS